MVDGTCPLLSPTRGGSDWGLYNRSPRFSQEQTIQSTEIRRGLFHLREISRDTDFLPVLLINDKHRCSIGIETLIGEDCSKSGPVRGPAAFVLAPTFCLSDVDGFHFLTALLHL